METRGREHTAPLECYWKQQSTVESSECRATGLRGLAARVDAPPPDHKTSGARPGPGTTSSATTPPPATVGGAAHVLDTPMAPDAGRGGAAEAAPPVPPALSIPRAQTSRKRSGPGTDSGAHPTPPPVAGGGVAQNLRPPGTQLLDLDGVAGAAPPAPSAQLVTGLKNSRRRIGPGAGLGTSTALPPATGGSAAHILGGSATAKWAAPPAPFVSGLTGAARTYRRTWPGLCAGTNPNPPAAGGCGQPSATTDPAQGHRERCVFGGHAAAHLTTPLPLQDPAAKHRKQSYPCRVVD